MTWRGPGFVDHHCRVIANELGRHREPSDVAAWHRLVSERWSTPLDEPVPPLELHDGTRGAIERALHLAREGGLVQITETAVDDVNVLEALLELRAKHGELPVRVRLLVASGAADPKKLLRTGDPWLEVEGVVFAADGWLGTRTCALERPFDDDDDAGRGILFLDADTLARRIDPFAEAGWTVATHAIGDRAIAAVLDAYEKVYGSDCASAAPRLEHAQVLTPELVRRIADLGVVVCIQPGAAVADLPDARRALGDRAEAAYRWDELLAAGVRVITGSDTEPLAPLVGLERLCAGGHGAVTFPLDVALGLMTDERAGTVTLADDPYATAEDELAQLQVDSTDPSPT
jgi:predicted amidohydrolase YtcJ